LPKLNFIIGRNELQLDHLLSTKSTFQDSQDFLNMMRIMIFK